MLTIFVASDSTGETAERVVRSALAQLGAAAQHPKMGSTTDVVLDDIREELMRSQILCLDHGWRRVDVTEKSVEEVALEILALLEPGTHPEVAEEAVAAPGDVAREHGQLGKGHRNEARPAGTA